MNRTQQAWGWEDEMRRTANAAKQETRQLIDHVNDRIVPEIRSGAITALQSLAGELRRAADWLEHAHGARRA
jgi:hypothetical protein